MYFHHRYADGSIRIWEAGKLQMTYRGHSHGITFLLYSDAVKDYQGGILASGSRNGDIVLWDTVSETGLARYKGHKDAISGLLFTKKNKLVSSSKDGLVKVWDILGDYCCETNVIHSFEVTGLASIEGGQIVTGSNDGQARIFDLKTDDLNDSHPSTESTNQKSCDSILTLFGTIQRNSSDKIIQVQSSYHSKYLFIQSGEKHIQILKVLSIEEQRKKLNRRKKRLKEKGTLAGPVSLDPVSLFPGEAFKLLQTIITRDKIRTFSPLSSKSTSLLQVQCIYIVIYTLI